MQLWGLEYHLHYDVKGKLAMYAIVTGWPICCSKEVLPGKERVPWKITTMNLSLAKEVTSGPCIPIKSKSECAAAVKELGLQVTIPDDTGVPSYYVMQFDNLYVTPWCYWQNGNIAFNTNWAAKKQCSDERHCICSDGMSIVQGLDIYNLKVPSP